MEKLNVPVMDVYEATFLSANHHRPSFDAMHYQPYFNEFVLDTFYKDEPFLVTNATSYSLDFV
jgi:hypothetical protein